jgi:cephalosporin hydroxylase
VQPDLIIETGVAHGGSVVLSASMLELIGHGQVVGVDIDIRPHNRAAIEAHPLAHRISLVQGSSVDPGVVAQVRALAAGKKKVLVCLDSNHTHEHVLAELQAYADLVSVGSYCIVFDTFVEDMPDDYVWTDRPWGKGNNPKTAVWEWIKEHPEFVIDKSVEDRLLVTSAPDGFLQRIA